MDLVAEVNNEVIPFEVKYRTQHTDKRELKGLMELCSHKNIKRAYVVTKSLNDFGKMEQFNNKGGSTVDVMKIPAPLLCYWMGSIEVN